VWLLDTRLRCLTVVERRWINALFVRAVRVRRWITRLSLFERSVCALDHAICCRAVVCAVVYATSFFEQSCAPLDETTSPLSGLLPRLDASSRL